MTAAAGSAGRAARNHPGAVRIGRDADLALSELTERFGVPAEVAGLAVSWRCPECHGRPTAVVLLSDEWQVEITHHHECPYLRAGIEATALTN